MRSVVAFLVLASAHASAAENHTQARPPAKEQILPSPKDRPCRITLTLIEQREKPVIEKGSPGTEQIKHGLEGGCVMKLGGLYHLFTAEMSGDPFWIKMRLGHWSSRDGLTWSRRDTMYVSSGDPTGKDPRAALWAPMPVYNEEEDRWNLFYVAYRAPVGPQGWHGRIWRAASKTKGREGIAGPWEDIGIVMEPGPGSEAWEGSQGTDSFFAYPVAGKWLGLYGSSNAANYWKVGLVSAPRLAGPWKRMPAFNPVTFNGRQGTENPVVTTLKSGRRVAVFDTITPSNVIGYAESVDRMSWSTAKQLELDLAKLWVEDVRTPLGLVEEPDGTFTLFYTGYAKKEHYGCMGLLRVRVSE